MSKKFNLKGTIFFLVLAIVFRLAIYGVGGASAGDESDGAGAAFFYIGGMILIFCGIGYTFVESFKNIKFKRVLAEDWGDLGLGGGDTSYSVMGTGVGLAGVTWPLWGGLVVGYLAISVVIRLAALHIAKISEEQHREVPVVKLMIPVAIVLIAALVATIRITVPVIAAM